MGAMLLRPLWRRHGRNKTVVLYGHKLSGNLLAIYRYWQAQAMSDLDMVFLTMDRVYHRQLRAEGVASVLATQPGTMALLSRADAIISDHGLHVMSILVGRSSIKFFDVWHGIPFKGFDAEDFRLQHRYDGVWVTSSLLAQLYVERFGFDPDKIKVTGYARTDRLVRRDEDVQAIKRRLGLNAEEAGKLILFAPTWKQDVADRSIWPFGESEENFLSAMSSMAQRTGCTVVIRSHLNSGAVSQLDYPRVAWVPFSTFPDTEALLLASDILVCDWSSISFDWLLLDRPAFFLDVSAPFAKGFSLGAEYRYGRIASNVRLLIDGITQVLANPDAYWRDHKAKQQSVKSKVYGEFADGRAAERCTSQLLNYSGIATATRESSR